MMDYLQVWNFEMPKIAPSPICESNCAVKYSLLHILSQQVHTQEWRNAVLNYVCDAPTSSRRICHSISARAIFSKWFFFAWAMSALNFSASFSLVLSHFSIA